LDQVKEINHSVHFYHPLKKVGLINCKNCVLFFNVERKNMEPLIITATPNISWMQPHVPFPATAKDIADEAKLCYEAGAMVLHIHAEGQWIETIRAIRATCDIIIQCGMSSLPIPERMDVFKEKGDLVSIILNHHDESFTKTECNVLHLKDELKEYARLCGQSGVLPEFEVWHGGSIWNLNWMIQQKLINPPYITTLFFGWPGGTWSPATIEEYLYRLSMIPQGSICTVSIMGPEQIDIITAAILRGDHVRVGTEDYPFSRSGIIATTHQLVEETVRIALAVGRPLATIVQARKIIGLDS
jgi:3-keto-5-aminohexanoate cleavage enzyme